MRAAVRALLNKTTIEALEPEATRRYVFDVRAPGLCLAIFPSGVKTFYVYRKIDGRPERIKLARWPEIGVEEARRLTAQALGAIASGTNPAESRRTKRGVPTLREAFEAFILLPTRTKAKRPKAKRTVKNYRQQFECYLKSWHGRRVTKITRREIETLHNKMAENNGPYIANRVLALLKSIYNTLLEDSVIQSNPAARLREFEEEERERFIQSDELQPFWKSVEAEPSQKMRDYFLLTLLTAQRPNNVAAMRWEDLNLKRGEWAMPHTKTGRHKVPIIAEAVAILKRRRKADPDGEWVFPAHHGGGHLKDAYRSWKSIVARSGLKDLRIYDLRRTMGSWQTKMGASRPIVGKLLGHKREQTTAIYGRLDLEPVRESVESATAAMLKAAGKGKRG